MVDVTLFYDYKPSNSNNSTQIISKLQNKITNFSYMHGTNMHASFDHLLDYSASYYSYLWSEVLADDMFSIFIQNGLLNQKIGMKFRSSIFEKGGSVDELDMVNDFLGRGMDKSVFLQKLGVE